jgi:hypothetical protein
MVFRQRPPAGGASALDDRLIYLGDDETGAPLEVMAVDLGGNELLIIHAMPLREKYRRQYEEAKKWRR